MTLGPLDSHTMIMASVLLPVSESCTKIFLVEFGLARIILHRPLHCLITCIFWVLIWTWTPFQTYYICFSIGKIRKIEFVITVHFVKVLIASFSRLCPTSSMKWFIVGFEKMCKSCMKLCLLQINHGKENSFFAASPCILEPWNTPSPTRYTYTYVRSSSRKVRCSASWRDIVVFRASETPRTPDLNSEGSWVLHDRTPVEASFYFYSFKIAKFLWT